MPTTDPRIATIAQGIAARLELERSFGVEHLAMHYLAPDQVLPDLKKAEPEGNPPPAAAVKAPESQPSPSVAASTERVTPEVRRVTTIQETPPPQTGSSQKQAALQPIREQAMTCQLCGLCETRTHVVFGEGSLDADIVFVGEAPGREEDEQARPFVGRAGRLLTRMIEGGLKMPRESVYICNILKCRPPGNRDPKPDEVVSCVPYLHQQLATIQPKVIVALGRIAGNILTEKNTSMGSLRGNWFTYQGIPLMPIYHPAYLLRQRQSAGGHSDADRRTWKDLQSIMQRLAES